MEQITIIIGALLTALLLTTLIGSLRALRTHDVGSVRATLFSWWGISLTILIFIVGLLSRLAQHFA